MVAMALLCAVPRATGDADHGRSLASDGSMNACLMNHVTFGQPDQKVYSQNGEDGILHALLYTCKLAKHKTFVEFGTESGIEINTRLLREQFGWSGLLMDGSFEDPAINLHKHFLRADNIVGLFEKYDVSKTELDLLSVDLDHNDFWVAREILQAGYRPRVYVGEINRNFPSSMSYTVVPEPDKVWDQSYYFGVSVSAYSRLLAGYGYSVVYVNKNGVNLFAVRNDLLDGGKPYTTPVERLWMNQELIHLMRKQAHDNEEWLYVPEGFDPTREDFMDQLKPERLHIRRVMAYQFSTHEYGVQTHHRPLIPP